MYALFKDGKQEEIVPCQISLEEMHRIKEEYEVLGVPIMYAIDVDGSLIVHPSAVKGYTIEKVKD